MTRNGAGFVANLSNLAWFGKTNATHSMEAFVDGEQLRTGCRSFLPATTGFVLIGPDGRPLSLILDSLKLV